MKHFFEANSPLDEFGLQQMTKKAREELKKKPMAFGEMQTKSLVMCFNATSASNYIPQGMESLLSATGYSTGDLIGDKDLKEIAKITAEAPSIMAYVLSSVQTKEVKGYLNLLFSLRTDFDLEPQILTHVPDEELVYYLKEFLSDSATAGKKVEIFSTGETKPWKTLEKPGDLLGVQTGKLPPAILQKPIFSDIKLTIVVGGVEGVKEFPQNKIRQALGNFNARLDPSGKVVKSKSSLYLKWKDIDSFKLASAQCKGLLGISLNGVFTPMAKLISDNVAGRWVTKKDIDFLRIRDRGQTFDLTPAEIIEMEFNLETNQMIFTRGVGVDEFHVARFNRLRLYRGPSWVTIHQTIPFNRGESNFDRVHLFLGSRYTEYEKIRQMRKGSVEFDILRQRRLVAGDLMSQLVLSSMNLLGVLTLDAPCLGFSPVDINNPLRIKARFQEEDQEIRKIFERILDLSDSPNFTDHNFQIRTKNLRAFLKDQSGEVASPEALELIIDELEGLIQYMDDFFKLNIYNRFQEDLEVDQAMDDLDKKVMEEAEALHLDEGQKDFIASNFNFFKKRKLCQSALLILERLRFFQAHMKDYIYNVEKEPDMVIYSQSGALVEHYRRTAYPALGLSQILPKESLVSENIEEDWAFIQFMRGLTQKVYHKAQEVNQSFHHQYKHTLAELSFIAQDHLYQLQEELRRLEDPANKEKAYVELHKKIREMFFRELKSKEEHIESLKAEQIETEKQIKDYHLQLQKLLGEPIPVEQIDQKLKELPQHLDKIGEEVQELFKKKRTQIVQVFNPFAKFQAHCFGYYQKVLGNMGLYQKALWITRKQKMLAQLKLECANMGNWTPEEVDQKIQSYKAKSMDSKKTEEAQSLMTRLTEIVQNNLQKLQQNSARGMFQDREKEKGTVQELLDYYQGETNRLKSLVTLTSEVFLALNKVEQEFFEAQVKFIDARLEVERGRYFLKIAQMLQKDPTCQNEVATLLTAEDEVPREIRKELNEIRKELIENYQLQKKLATPENLDKICDFSPLTKRQERRMKINEVAKYLVNLRQVKNGVAQEIKGELQDLEYMKGQEGVLEKVAMSKALPSTRILLKSQYIPLVEREIAMLNRSDAFLGAILSKSKELTNGLLDCFFRKRHGFPQFAQATVFVDSQAVAKSHLVKNIQAAFNLMLEKWEPGLKSVEKYEMRGRLNKENVQEAQILRNKIQEAWSGARPEKAFFLPPTLAVEDFIQLCDFKAEIVHKDPRPSKSLNSLVLIYVGEIPFAKIKADAKLLERYHRAIMSNIFVNVDGETVFNNRDSIYEAIIRSTFHAASDPVSQQVGQTLLYEV